MMDQAKIILWDVTKSTLGIVGFNMVGAPQRIRSVLPSDNKILGYGADGLGYALVSEGIDYLSGDQSTIVNGDWYGYIDNIAFMGVISGVSNESGLVKFAFDQLNGVSPLDARMNLNITEGLIVSTGRVLGDYIDRSPVPDQLKILRHPTRLIK